VNPRQRTVAIWGGALVVAFLAYIPALRVGWVFDDIWNIVEAPSLHWTEISREAFSQALTYTFNSRRVVSNVSFALNHLAGGLDPRGYHLVNVLLHLAAGTALAWLLALYLRKARAKESAAMRAGVLLPAALFLLHPVNTQAVTYVVQRMTVLAALFTILSFAAYLKGRTSSAAWRRWSWLTAAALLWILGLASKENAAVLPLVLLTWEWCFGGLRADRVRGSWRSWKPAAKAGAAAAVLGAVVVIGALGLRFAGSPATWLETLPTRDFSALERVLTQSRVGLLYLGLIIWPTPGRLNLDHDVAVSRGLLDPASTLPAVAFWTLAVIGALLLARRRPLYGFPLLAYIGCHLIEAGPFNLELVFEHRLYLPLAMLMLLPAAALAELPRDKLRPAVGAGLVIALWLGSATFVRNTLWADPIEFHRDIAEKSPNKPRAQVFLAQALLEAGRAEEALTPAQRAVALDSTDYDSRLKLGDVYRATGAPEEAYAVYRDAAALDPARFDAPFRAGLALEQAGRTDEAFQQFMDVGVQLGRAGRPFEAIPALERAVELRPESSVAHNLLGNVYALADLPEAALAEYEAAVRLDDSSAEAVYNLAQTLEQLGRTDEAVPWYQRFVEIAPPHLGEVVASVRAKLEAVGR
jgi:tetratricopeptide (TPR) repeat protein